MLTCSRWLLRLLPLVISHLVLEVTGVGYPERSQHSFTFRPRDPAPRGSSDLSAAKLSLSAEGAVSGFSTAPALIEHGTQQRERFMLASKPHVASKSHQNPYDESWKHRGDTFNATAANSTTTPEIASAPGFELGDYGLSINDLDDPNLQNMNLTNVTHTWGDQKHNVMGLPSWAAVLVGGTAAAIIVICTNMVGNRLSHPLPFFASDEQRLKDQVEQAKEKVRLLKEAVKVKREQEKKAAEEEARKQRGEVIKEEPGPSYDELVGEMLYRTQEVQNQAVGAVNDSLKQAAPLLARAAYVQTVFSDNMKLVQERAGDMALREASSLYGKMRDAVGLEDEVTGTEDALARRNSAMVGYDLPDWFSLDDENDLDPPPFALLVGGMFAPAQIKLTRANCQSQIVWNSIIVATCTACAVIDNRHSCHDKLVWAWQYGMLALNGIDILCCSFIASRCASAICVLSDDEDKIGRVPETGNAVWDAFITMQANSGQFFKAYFKYQGIIDSPIYTFQKFMCFVSLAWGFLGIYVTCQDVVEDTLLCDAKVVLWFMHTYSFFFMLFLTWTLLGLIIWILQKLSGLTCVTAPIMDSAKNADDEVPFKMPIFQTLARSFLLRDSSTMLHIKARQLEGEVANLEHEVDDTKTKLAQRKTYLEQLERQKGKAHENERKLILEYKQKQAEKEGKTLEEFEGASGATGGEGLTGESSSTPLFEGPSAAELFAQASSSVAAAHEVGLTASLQQAQSYAQESGLLQNATDVFSSAQASATEASARAQQFAEEQGATDALTRMQQGATDTLARTQQLAEEHGSTTQPTPTVETALVGEATDSSSSTAEVQPEMQPTGETAPAGEATDSSSSTAQAQPETQPQSTEPTRPAGGGLGEGDSF